MLTWQDGYRIGEGVKKAEKVKSRLDAGKFVQGIYLLTLSENPANIMDVIPAAYAVAEELLQDLSSYYRNGRGQGGSAGNGEMSG